MLSKLKYLLSRAIASAAAVLYDASYSVAIHCARLFNHCADKRNTAAREHAQVIRRLGAAYHRQCLDLADALVLEAAKLREDGAAVDRQMFAKALDLEAGNQ